MNAAALQRLTRKYASVLDDISTTMVKNDVTEAEGEILLLYLAGLSAGNRQHPVNGKEWLTPSAIGWCFAAEHGGE